MFKLLALLGALFSAGYYYYGQSGAGKVKVPNELNATYDYIIAGTGTAGSVLAARLSENPSISVLALEAGGEEKSKWYSHIPGFQPYLQLTDFDWAYTTTPQQYCCDAMKNKQSRWPRGKALGGSSSHNWMNYVRCNPRDYDHWENLGNPGWSYKDLLVYFKRIENMQIPHLGGRREVRGYEGPIIVNEGYRTPLGESLMKSFVKAGYKFNDDYNGLVQEGVSWVQFNIDKSGRRQSMAAKILRPAIGRPNLDVVTGAQVTKILFDTKSGQRPRAIGLEYIHNGQTYTVKANAEVILSGGAINSPQLLMLSGIGPRAHLQSLGIPVLVDNPAVGRNLYDHMIAYLMFKTNDLGKIAAHSLTSWSGYLTHLAEYYLYGTGPLTKTPTEITGFVRTGLYEPAWPDVQIYFTNPASFPPFDIINLTPEAIAAHTAIGENTFMVASYHLHPTDEGYVKLQSADPLTPPIIEPYYYKSEVDVKAVAKGLRIMLDILKQSDKYKEYDIQFAETATPGCEKYKLLSNEYLMCTVRSRCLTLYHPVGTCRMGPKGNNSVVDHELRVHGVDGLRIADASIFPEQLSGNTHMPSAIVGEKASDLIRQNLLRKK